MPKVICAFHQSQSNSEVTDLLDELPDFLFGNGQALKVDTSVGCSILVDEGIHNVEPDLSLNKIFTDGKTARRMQTV